MRIMVKPASDADVVLENGSILKADECPKTGVPVQLTLFIRRRIAAGELVNVTPKEGVPDVELPPASPPPPDAAAKKAPPAPTQTTSGGVS